MSFFEKKTTQLLETHYILSINIRHVRQYPAMSGNYNVIITLMSRQIIFAQIYRILQMYRFLRKRIWWVSVTSQ